MSTVADKYTLALPWLEPAPNNASTTTSLPPCLFANLFNLGNATFGAFTTAPDGSTTTAQKINEDSSTNQHYVQGGGKAIGGQMRVRCAGIWQAAERTRICYFNTSNPFGSPLGDTAYCGFDLAGGQIAYGMQTTGLGSTYFSYQNQTIVPLGGGWMLCYVDVMSLVVGGGDGFQGGGLNFRFILDNGSGTAAPSISYAGNTSTPHGLYGWKHSILPRRAWKLNNVAFFDDFNDPTMANIDINNTQAPGFDWYVQCGCWPNWYRSQPPTPGQLSVSASKLHIPALPTIGGGGGSPTGAWGGGVTTFCQPGSGNVTNNGVPPGAGVGKGWRFPFMLEYRYSYDYPNSQVGGDGSLWLGSVEFTNLLSLNRRYTNGDVGYTELDPSEPFGVWGISSNGTNGQGPEIGHLPGNLDAFGPYWPGAPGGNGYAFYGFPPYVTAFGPFGFNLYGGGVGVNSGGLFYYQSNGSFPGTIPAPPAAPWVAFTYPPGATTHPSCPCFNMDFSQLNNYCTMFLDYDPATGDRGGMLQFFNGAFLSGVPIWTPSPTASDSSSPAMHKWAAHQFFVQMNFSQAGAGFFMDFDYVRITQ
jgi:hypothetical protein